jgi:hypothetical protein
MAKRLDGSVRKKTLGRRGGSMAGAQVGNIETSRDVLERYLQRAIKHPLLWEKVRPARAASNASSQSRGAPAQVAEFLEVSRHVAPAPVPEESSQETRTALPMPPELKYLFPKMTGARLRPGTRVDRHTHGAHTHTPLPEIEYARRRRDTSFLQRTVEICGSCANHVRPWRPGRSRSMPSADGERRLQMFSVHAGEVYRDAGEAVADVRAPRRYVRCDRNGCAPTTPRDRAVGRCVARAATPVAAFACAERATCRAPSGGRAVARDAAALAAATATVPARRQPACQQRPGALARGGPRSRARPSHARARVHGSVHRPRRRWLFGSPNAGTEPGVLNGGGG